MPLYSVAQMQSAQWVFGDHTSIDFTRFNRAIGTASGMDAPEGSAVISDNFGNLLFYSNGEQVWNRNHAPMLGGTSIKGSKSCTQSSIIVPDPGNVNRYYLFTLTGNTSAQPGLYYHVIDMSGDNGKGVVFSKDNFLLTTIEEKLTSAFHTNGKDSWVFTFHDGNIYSFLVNAGGVGTPIQSGNSYAGPDNKKGAMKVSPDGSMLGVARTELINGLLRPFVELYVLNRQNGTVQEKRVMEIVAPADVLNPAKYLYGFTFNADSKAFYVSTFEPTQPLGVAVMVYKIDIKTGNHLLNGSYTRTGMGLGPLGGALQLGPDKRVYFLMSNSLNGEVSTNSLLQGYECVTGPPLQFTLSGLDFRGLPNFNDMIFAQPDPSFQVQAGNDFIVCSGQDITFQPVVQTGLNYTWNPTAYLNNANVARPTFNKILVGDSPQLLPYVVLAQRPNCSQLVTNSDTLTVTLLPQPYPPSIIGSENICVDDLKSKSYSVDSLSNHHYTWEIIGGEFIGTNNRKTVVVNWSRAIGEHSIKVTAVNSYGCQGEQAIKNIEIKPLPINPGIQGSRFVCPSVKGVAYWLKQTESGLAYRWNVVGGTIVSAINTDTVRVNWGPSSSNASVSVAASDEYGCKITTIFPVRIFVEIKPELPNGNEVICNNKKENNIYSVLKRPGSVYFWRPSNGTVSAGQGTHEVSITWPGPGKYSVFVEETNTTIDTVCFGKSDPLEVLVYQDSSKLNLSSISLQSDDSQQVLIKWDTEFPTFTSLQIDKRKQGGEQWINAGISNPTVNLFKDFEPETSTGVFEYRLRAQNACEERLEPPFHNLIFLQASKTPQDNIVLTWNPYINWKSKVLRYEVYRKVDSENEFKLFATVLGETTTFETASDEDGFLHSFYVRAIENGTNQKSISNTTKIEFEHPIVIPNVFTPNGDQFNETFIIPKIHLYPINEIIVVNRYGKQVFATRNYRGDWDGGDLSEGIYYYYLKVPDRNLSFNGWVMIVR